jgi:hypothetical protein
MDERPRGGQKNARRAALIHDVTVHADRPARRRPASAFAGRYIWVCFEAGARPCVAVDSRFVRAKLLGNKGKNHAIDATQSCTTTTTTQSY